MKEVSDNYWSIQKFMESYTGEGQALLDYLDETLSNPYIEPNLTFIKESLIKILNAHNLRITNLELFGLIRWEQVILNNMDDYAKVVPEKYEKILDKETEINIKDILDNLKWQSGQMQKVLVDNIETFQRSYFDLQTPLLKTENLSQDLIKEKEDLLFEFNKIWDYQEKENFDDDFVFDLN